MAQILGAWNIGRYLLYYYKQYIPPGLLNNNLAKFKNDYYLWIIF